MRGFALGIVAALAAIACGVFAVSRFGLYPIGADNPPSSLERTLASKAMNVYVDRHKPDGENPVSPTPEILTDDDMWRIVAFIKHSDKLPPEAESAWRTMADGPSGVE